MGVAAKSLTRDVDMGRVENGSIFVINLLKKQ